MKISGIYCSAHESESITVQLEEEHQLYKSRCATLDFTRRVWYPVGLEEELPRPIVTWHTENIRVVDDNGVYIMPGYRSVTKLELLIQYALTEEKLCEMLRSAGFRR